MSDTVIYTIIVFITGFIMILYGISSIVKRKSCKVKVDAEYTGAATFYGRYGNNYAPKFKYTYNGVEHTSQCFERFSRAKIAKLISNGNTCTIYMNEKKPGIICVTRKISFIEILKIIFGLHFWFGAVCILLIP